MRRQLSIQEARKLVLLSQCLPQFEKRGDCLDIALATLKQLGYVQIDSISVIQRAHHHTLWNRNPRYQSEYLDQLLIEKKAFEYWSHAAAYLPMCHYRYSLPRKRALANGQQNHWYERDPRMMRYVLDRIRAEGPLRARDFENNGPKTKEWQQKPAKQALEYLFMQGDLMVPYRIHFHKVYDLTENVLPADIDDRLPGPLEYACFLIKQFLLANGIGQLNEFGYLLKGMRPTIQDALHTLLKEGEVLPVTVQGVDGDYYWLPQAEELLNTSLSRSKLKILSPFDNLLIQRKRAEQLFNFSYQIECYLPSTKRQYGYFSLPILWNGRLLARMDCKAERKTEILHIHFLALEPWLKQHEAFVKALHKTLRSFLAFNGCRTYHLHACSEPVVGRLMQQYKAS